MSIDAPQDEAAVEDVVAVVVTDTAGVAAEPILILTPRAIDKVLEIREGEDEPETVGLRVAVTGAYGVDYTYDLSFETISEAAADDVQRIQGGITVMIPEDSVEKLTGATLDLPSNEGQGGLVIRNPNRPNPLEGLNVELTGTIAEKVQTLLEASINPSLAAHGGYATLVGVDEETNNVFLTMGGGCQGCSMSAATLVEGIQVAIKEGIPEVNEVVDATDHSAGDNPYYN